MTIGAGSITSVMLAAGAVGSNQLAAGAVTTGALAEGAVTAAKVATVSNWFALTIANPAPAAGDRFGSSVAALGTDRVLIGAYFAGTSASDAGAAYLLSANGALLTTFTNPTPADYDNFGRSVAAVESDRVLIGAPGDNTGATESGAAYLFSTNGTLHTTFTNPIPAVGDGFGWSVAAVGDRVLIGAPYDSAGAFNAGAAYLFNTDGELITTFTNPAPAAYDRFGWSVAAVGTDQVLIGAYGDDTGANQSGAAYLFSTSGVWLSTFTNPTPAPNDWFGISVTALGTDRVLIGANLDSTVANNAGAAYLFSLERFTPGLVADGVNARSVTTASLEDGTVTVAKLDPTIGVWTRSGDNIFRLTGNVGIGTSSFTSNRLEVAGMVGATAFNTTSDCAAKQDFTAVDAQAVLAKVAALPITQWRFKDFPGALHLGPMAQDFHAAFGVGSDDKHIATVDADGVALAAIQGLNQKVEEQRAELTQKETEIAELRARLAHLEKLIDKLNPNEN